MSEKEIIDKAMKLISDFGHIDGNHHKQWLLDQVARTLLQDEYEEWASGDEETERMPWDIGIAP